MPALPDRLLIEIGRVAAFAGELDLSTALMWTALCLPHPTPGEAPAILAVAARRMSDVRREIRTAVRTYPEEIRGEIDGWLDQAAELAEERNRVIHALWLSELAERGGAVTQGWHPRSGEPVSEDPAAWNGLALRLGGCAVNGWILIDKLRTAAKLQDHAD